MYVSRFGSHGDQRPVTRRLKIRAAVDTRGVALSQAPHRVRLRLFAELIARLKLIFRQKTRCWDGQLQGALNRGTRVNACDPIGQSLEAFNGDAGP